MNVSFIEYLLKQNIFDVCCQLLNIRDFEDDDVCDVEGAEVYDGCRVKSKAEEAAVRRLSPGLSLSLFQIYKHLTSKCE